MKLTIGEKIALLRRQRNITQTELAEYLFLAPQTVSRWEVGSGAPEITLLPKIAAFFSVSIDELFGLTDLKRVEDLVCKYSVLRDDHSFQEAMECIDSQCQTIDALLQNAGEDTEELERDRDQLEAEKLHMWIQQGREAFQRAYKIADAFVQKTEGQPEHRWYLPMRLQRDQICLHIGRRRESLAERRQELIEHPDTVSLRRYLSMLSDLQDYEAILSVRELGAFVEELLSPPAQGKNLGLWNVMLHAAAAIGNTDFVERHLPPVLEACGEEDEYYILMGIRNLYSGEKLAALKERMLALLPQVIPNKYFQEKALEMIQQYGS